MSKKLPIYDERMIMLMEHCVESGIERTQGTFLKGIGLQEQALSQINSGTSSFRAKHILTAGMKYGIDFNWFFGISGSMKRLPGKSSIQNLKDAVKAIEAELVVNRPINGVKKKETKQSVLKK